MHLVGVGNRRLQIGSERMKPIFVHEIGGLVLSTWVDLTSLACHACCMSPVKPALSVSSDVSYRGYRFPKAVIAFAVWLYFRFPLSLHMVEEMSWSPTSCEAMVLPSNP